MLFGEGDQRRARREAPFPPRRNDLDVGVERVGREFEAHLIIALAGRAMGDRIGAHFVRDLDQPLGDQRPRDRGAKQILTLILRVGAEHREHVVAHEFLAHVLDEDVFRPDAKQFRLFPRRLELLALAEIGGEGDDLGAVFGLQPLENDGSVEPARIGEDDALDLRLLWARHALAALCGKAVMAGQPWVKPGHDDERALARKRPRTYRPRREARNPALNPARRRQGQARR